MDYYKFLIVYVRYHYNGNSSGLTCSNTGRIQQELNRYFIRELWITIYRYMQLPEPDCHYSPIISEQMLLLNKTNDQDEKWAWRKSRWRMDRSPDFLVFVSLNCFLFHAIQKTHSFITVNYLMAITYLIIFLKIDEDYNLELIPTYTK